MIICAIVGVFFGFALKSLDTLKTKFGELSYFLCDFNYLTVKPLSFIVDLRL